MSGISWTRCIGEDEKCYVSESDFWVEIVAFARFLRGLEKTEIVFIIGERGILQLPILPGQICDVTMTFAVNVAQFFLQQPNDPTFSQLNELHTQLNIFYRNWPNYPIVTVPMHANETQYCAVYMGNTFVRGATVGYIVESDEMMVRLIDLGGYISHPRSTLRKLCEEAFHLPGQAIASQLAYVKPLTVHFDPRGEAVIKELCIGKRIKARCLGYTLDSSQALVELYVTFPDQKIERLDMFLRQNNFAAPSEMVAYSPTVPALFFQNRV
ncbi:unnamed protein product [Caenorhabditis auriculariae]|uniref:Tudor domain-containing protein n=1 Tax=Caenorhabditis auriculariae TaxID=2777116 RepID=A0A8S1GX43_9PELO|nr:unnamed protein product [Caenorhabditis auriculariae]